MALFNCKSSASFREARKILENSDLIHEVRIPGISISMGRVNTPFRTHPNFQKSPSSRQSPINILSL
jgi:hypothetical protein